MKTLLLMRHAKSSWKEVDLPDIERKLNKRGKKDAPEMGALIREKELIPQRILSSTAARCRLTVEAMGETSGFSGPVDYHDSLYLAEPQAYIDAVKAVPDGEERILVMGHNPGLEGLLQMLTDQVESLPTGALAYLSLPLMHWSELSLTTKAELIEVYRPHDMRERAEEDAEREKREKKERKEQEVKAEKEAKAEKKTAEKKEKSKKKK